MRLEKMNIAATENRNGKNEDDMITLYGCGKITKWRFPPNTKQCPVHLCRELFGLRSDAIRHYKKRHAPNAILCELCSKPIAVTNSFNFVQHYKFMHPDVEVPYSFHSSSSNGSSAPVSESRNRNNTEDDFITLRGQGIITKWRFPPNITQCPVRRCYASYASRSDAMAHYKEKHARFSILCPICVKPIITHSAKDYYSHHLSIHPNDEMSYDFSKENRSAVRVNLWF